jgi:hypothetical protein
VRVRLGSVGWTNGRRFGDVWLGLWLWKLLGLDQILERHLPQGKETVRPADIVAIEVINRLCGPSLVPTVPRGNAVYDAPRRREALAPAGDAERPGRHSHPEHGNEFFRYVVIGYGQYR